MLFASREVPIKKNCARGLEYRPRWYSRQIVQFFPERTDLNWWIIYIYIYIFFFFNLRKFFLKEPEWFKAVTTARSSINWTIFERVKTPLYTFFFILKLWEFACLFAAMACVNLVFPPQKLNLNRAKNQSNCRIRYRALWEQNERLYSKYDDWDWNF